MKSPSSASHFSCCLQIILLNNEKTRERGVSNLTRLACIFL